MNTHHQQISVYIKIGKVENFEIYVVGILLYCILTGHLPYKGSTSLEDCHLAHEPYIDPRDDNYIERPFVRRPSRGYDKLLLTDIQDIHLRKVIEKATRENPSKRFQSAIEFINELETPKEEPFDGCYGSEISSVQRF